MPLLINAATVHRTASAIRSGTHVLLSGVTVPISNAAFLFSLAIERLLQLQLLFVAATMLVDQLLDFVGARNA